MTKKTQKIYKFLKSKFPDAKCELRHKDIYQLLVSVILSAQCTDVRVNIITSTLFKKYPTIYDMANANVNELEKEIKSCGLYRNKARNIIAACKEVINKYNGQVPDKFEDLITLRGVGKKTANVIISVGFGGDAIAVDTHVFRVSKRLGLADAKTPEKVGDQLEKIIDKSLWSECHYLMVLFGRYICKAQRPLCEECELQDLCKYYKKQIKNNQKTNKNK